MRDRSSGEGGVEIMGNSGLFCTEYLENEAVFEIYKDKPEVYEYQENGEGTYEI